MTAPAVSRPHSRRAKLPSVESQTVEFVRTSRKQLKDQHRRWLEWGGFKVYARYCQQYPADETIFGEILVIASVEVPKRLRGRGWFWYYCELCLALVDDGLIIESVINKELRRSLSMRPEFIEISPNTFFLKKRGPDHRQDLLQAPPLDLSEKT